MPVVLMSVLGIAELAINWVMEHMGDADFSDPLPAPGAASGQSPPQGSVAGGGSAPDPEALMMLTSLGFTERQAEGALKATGGDAARGADWLFSHTDDLDAAVAEVVREDVCRTSVNHRVDEPPTNTEIKSVPFRITRICWVASCCEMNPSLKASTHRSVTNAVSVSCQLLPDANATNVYCHDSNSSPR